MTRIYLDVHSRVRVDTTPDHRLASIAEGTRILLRLLSAAERLDCLLLAADVETDRDPTETLAKLAATRRMRSQVFTEAI